MYDDDGFFVFLFFYVLTIGAILTIIFVGATSPDEPSRAVVQCVETRMETLEGVGGMWSGESERAEMAAALEDFCEAVQ